jgi:hypothetical protein
LACFGDDQTTSARSGAKSLLFDRRLGGKMARTGETALLASFGAWPHQRSTMLRDNPLCDPPEAVD